MRKGNLRRMSLAVIELMLTVLLAGATGYTQEPPLPGASSSTTAALTKTGSPSPGRVVLKVGDGSATEADIDLMASLDSRGQQPAPTQNRQPLGEKYALLLVLAQQAVRDRLDSSAELVRQMALERIERLAQAEYTNLAKEIKVNSEEVRQYYSTHPDEFTEVTARRVFVQRKPEGGKPDAPGLSPQEAKARADSIRQDLAAGKDPKELVKEFKSLNEGFMDVDPRTFRLPQLPAEWQKVVSQLKDGEVVQPVDTPQGIAFFQMRGRRQVELKDVSSEIENKLRQQKLDAAVADLKKKTVIWMDEEYFKAPPALPPPVSAQPPAGNGPGK